MKTRLTREVLHLLRSMPFVVRLRARQHVTRGSPRARGRRLRCFPTSDVAHCRCQTPFFLVSVSHVGALRSPSASASPWWRGVVGALDIAEVVPPGRAHFLLPQPPRCRRRCAGFVSRPRTTRQEGKVGQVSATAASFETQRRTHTNTHTRARAKRGRRRETAARCKTGTWGGEGRGGVCLCMRMGRDVHEKEDRDARGGEGLGRKSVAYTCNACHTRIRATQTRPLSALLCRCRESASTASASHSRCLNTISNRQATSVVAVFCFQCTGE